MKRQINLWVFALILIVTAMLLIVPVGTQAAPPPVDKTLQPDTRFFVPQPDSGAVQQALSLLKSGQVKKALLIAAMEFSPRAVWITGGTPSQTQQTVKQTISQAREAESVPVFVLYNVPNRDCGGYSAGGAQDTATYEAWIDAVAGAIGNHKVVIVLEPDGLALLPGDCGYDAQATADRYTQINYAVTKLEANPRTLVYLDAGHSAWHSVGDMAARLVQGGLMQTQGFYSNASNYRATNYETKFDTWISECIAFANDPEEGGWRLGHYDYCASQYFSPFGSVNPNDISTWVYSDQWYAANMGTAVPTTHFLIDTSRNGQGPFDASSYAAAPYNQPASVIATLNGGNWCNPPARGLGLRGTANTGVPLLDAYLWVKVPGESDGSCNAQGGVRAWDYTQYTQPGWPSDAASQALFDPLWGLVDPAAGQWFPQAALDLAQRANPPLHFHEDD
jgi:endoglucanase